MIEEAKVSADLYRYTEHNCQLKRKEYAPFNRGRRVGPGVQRDAGKSAYRPDVQVNVPPEVFSSSGQRAQPCSQCCIYQDQNYSEGAVIKADGVLLQCQRDEKRSARIRWSGVA
jgi:hypothetical protein